MREGLPERFFRLEIAKLFRGSTAGDLGGYGTNGLPGQTSPWPTRTARRPTVRKLEATLERLAKQRGQSKSDVVRDALERFASEQEGDATSALDRLRPFMRIADSGGQQLSNRTGQRFREMPVEIQQGKIP